MDLCRVRWSPRQGLEAVAAQECALARARVHPHIDGVLV